MIYYKPKNYQISVAPSLFTTEPPSVQESMILDSRILSEEKLNLNNKFALLDQFSHRQLVTKDYKLVSFPTFIKNNQQNTLDAWGETTLQLVRNQFYYTSIDIYEKYSPVTLMIFIKKGDPNIKMRLFGSVKFQQPNRFNAEIETYGRILKYSCKEGYIFQDQMLYVAIMAQNDVTITIRSEFSKPPVSKKIPQLKLKQEFPSDIEELAEAILRKRKLRQSSLNFVNFNKSQLRKIRIESPCTTERLKETKNKQHIIQKEQSLKRIAQIAMHDVIKEIRQKQYIIQRKQMHIEWIRKNWIKTIFLVNYIVPSLQQYILVQKKITEKNIKKQIFILQFYNKLIKYVHLQGNSLKYRTLCISKFTLMGYIKIQKKKIKQKAQLVIITLLKANIPTYITLTKGLHTVNLSNYHV